VLHFIDSHELFTQEGVEIIPPTLLSSPSPLLAVLSRYPSAYPYRVLTIAPRRVFEDVTLPLKDFGLGRSILLIVEEQVTLQSPRSPTSGFSSSSSSSSSSFPSPSSGIASSTPTTISKEDDDDEEDDEEDETS